MALGKALSADGNKEESNSKEAPRRSISKLRWMTAVHSSRDSVEEEKRQSQSEEVDLPAPTEAASSTAVQVTPGSGSTAGAVKRPPKTQKGTQPKKADAASKQKGGFMQVMQMLNKRELQRKEACDSIRFLVFGCLADENTKNQNRQKVYDLRRGNREEVFKLYKVWSQMDEDGSGDVEFQEFLNFFSKSKADRLLGMRCVKFLVGGEESSTSCTIEDMMKLIWLKAGDDDIKVMLKWFREAAFHQERVPTPPLLPKKRRKELMENFYYLDRSRAGKITYSDLVDGGLVDWEMALELMEKYDADGSGDLDVEEFLELLCPFGYRAHTNARAAIDSKGRQLAYIDNSYFTGWTTEGAFDAFPECFLAAKE